MQKGAVRVLILVHLFASGEGRENRNHLRITQIFHWAGDHATTSWWRKKEATELFSAGCYRILSLGQICFDCTCITKIYKAYEVTQH